ncbi:hypothetical protein [Enterocloster bolteae]|nr:hypothetical protein [Enterocloster bolteae]
MSIIAHMGDKYNKRSVESVEAAEPGILKRGGWNARLKERR